MSIVTPARTLLTTVALLALASLPASAQNFDGVDIRVEQVAPGIAVLFGAGGNIAVNYGADGTIVIDDQFAPLTPKITAAIAALQATPAKYLINTHWHFDHSGGNENFGRAGAIIMAQEHVRDRMAAGGSVGGNDTPPAPAVALPVITWHDGITLHMNGGAIRTMHMPHAHTDGDSVVWFKDANVVHMGDLYFNKVTLPFIDLSSGGNVRGVLAGVERVLTMIDDATVVIPGHGPVSNKAELTAYAEMLRTVIATVEREKAAGKTLEQIIAMRPAARWDTNPDAFIKGDAFVTAVWMSLEQPQDHISQSATSALAQNSIENGAVEDADFELLDGAAIRSMIAGKMILGEGPQNEQGLRFLDVFYPDGRWHGAFERRGPISVDGRWDIVDDRVCIYADNGYSVCRSILRNKHTSEIYIRTFRPNDESIKRFNVKLTDIIS